MARLVAGKVRKLLSTWLWLWLLLGAVGLTALYVSLAIAFGDDPGDPDAAVVKSGGQRTVFSAGRGPGRWSRYWARSATPASFGTRPRPRRFWPRRIGGRVVLAKLITYPVVGAAYAVVCLASTSAIAVLWLSAKGIPVLWATGIRDTMAGVVIAVAFYGALGWGWVRYCASRWPRSWGCWCTCSWPSRS